MKARIGFSHTLSFIQVSEKYILKLFTLQNFSQLKDVYDDGFSSKEVVCLRYLEKQIQKSMQSEKIPKKIKL